MDLAQVVNVKTLRTTNALRRRGTRAITSAIAERSNMRVQTQLRGERRRETAMDGDKELIDKLQHVWHSARPFPQEPWDRIIALVREHDGRRWERLHSASKNTRAWLSRNGLEGNSAYDDLVAALNAIPQSAEPPAPAADARNEAYPA